MHSDYVRTACIQQQLSPQELWAPRTPSPARQRHTSKGTGPIVRTQCGRKRRSMLTPPCRAVVAGSANTRSRKSEPAKKRKKQHRAQRRAGAPLSTVI